MRLAVFVIGFEVNKNFRLFQVISETMALFGFRAQLSPHYLTYLPEVQLSSAFAGYE